MVYVLLAIALQGTVQDLATGAPIGSAIVVSGETSVSTDEDGRFEIDADDGTVLEVRADRYEVLRVRVLAAGPRPLVIELVPTQAARDTIDLGAEEITVHANRETVDRTPTVSAHTIERGAVDKTPGSLEDVTRVLALKTGIVTVGEFAPVLYVRGGDIYQTYFFLDGVLIFNPFQPIGGGTIFNPDLVEKAEVYTGGQHASFPEALSGVIDMTHKQPEDDRLHAYLDASVISANARVEGPLSDTWSGLLSLRRSNYDPILAVLGAIMPELSDVASPSFLNGFANATWKPTPRDRVSFNAMAVENKLVNFAFEDEDREVSNKVFFQDRQVLGWAQWTRLFGDSSVLKTNLSSVYDVLQANSTGTDPLAVDVATYSIGLRADYAAAPRPGFGWEAGGYIGRLDFELLGKVGDFRQVQPGVAFGGDPNVPLRDIFPATVFIASGVYGQFYVDVDRLTIYPGVRVVYNDATDEVSVGPRLNVSWKLSDRAAIKAAFGLFNQPPYNPVLLDPTFGNPKLTAERAIHYVLGFEGEIPGGVFLKTEAFYKDVFDQVMPQDFRSVDFENPSPADLAKISSPFLNVGATRAYGAEASIVREVAGGLRFEANYSLLKVETENPLLEDPANRTFSPYQDQRHTMNLVGNWRRGNWTFSATYRFATGKPFTPILGWREEIDVSTDVGPRRIWVPDELAPFNTARYPVYHRVDMRAERFWKFDKWKMTAYAEVLSAQVRRNTEFISYTAGNPDGNPPQPPVRKDVLGIPTIPYFGLRGEF